MPFSIATWNINSVRLRLPLAVDLLETHRPDVLCLQETKCQNDQFPSAAFRKIGYEHLAVHGQKGYHGVAIVARTPLSLIDRRDYCGIGDSRHVSAVVVAGEKRIRLHNFYVPAGGDIPDPAINAKFSHKLDFLQEMKALHAESEAGEGISSVLVGDLNVAPLETDVWSHRQLLKIVSHTPVETDGLTDVLNTGAWVDVVRRHIPPEETLFTWWSYRAKDWAASNRGRRLDHVWASADLAGASSGIDVLSDARGWPRPSDHVPVIARFDV